MFIGQLIRQLYPLALALFYELKTKCSTTGMEQALCSPYTTLLYHLLLCDFFQRSSAVHFTWVDSQSSCTVSSVATKAL